MSLPLPDRPVIPSAFALQPQAALLGGFRRSPPERALVNRLSARPNRADGSLRVNVTLVGDPYALRHVAKAAGYRWFLGQWHRELKLTVPDHGRQSRVARQTRFGALVAAETVRFPQPTVGDVHYVPGDALQAPDTVQGEPQVALQLTSTAALLSVLQRTPLVVPNAGRGWMTLQQDSGAGCCVALSMMEAGVSYQLPALVLEEAEVSGLIRFDPVWLPADEGASWRPLYPMTSRWLEARQTGPLSVGQRLTLA